MNSMASARAEVTRFGTESAAVAAGGLDPNRSVATEEWTGPSTTLNYKTLTTS
jgi:hypothetical protein